MTNEDSHFMDELNNELIDIENSTKMGDITEFINQYVFNENSPISSPGSLSPCNSSIDISEHARHSSPADFLEFLQKNRDTTAKESNKSKDSREHKTEHKENSDYEVGKFKKLSYDDVEKSISKYYSTVKLSNEFDLLITFLKGKKNIYIQSKNLTQYYLNLLNLIMICITAGVAVFGPMVNRFRYSIYLISALNSIIAVLISLANYLKLESTVDNFLCISNQHQKLETIMEMTSNKLFFIRNEKERNKIIIQKIDYLEDKLKDINETYQLIVPELIKRLFPVVSHINIFVFIKKIEIYKNSLITDLRNIKNEIRYILYKWETSNGGLSQPNCIHEKRRLEHLLKLKEEFKTKIFHCKNTFNYIDEIFSEETRNAEQFICWIRAIFCIKNKNFVENKYDNPIIQEIFRQIR